MNNNIETSDFNDYFNLLEKLHERKMCQVYKCNDKYSNNLFTSKTFNLKLAKYGNSKLIKAKVFKELSILQSLKGHQNIVTYYTHFQSKLQINIIFEYCNNGNLLNLLTLGALTENKTKMIMTEIFNGVKFIHNNNIIHRDLKPENILLDNYYKIKIIDFGFAARCDDSLKELKEYIGTVKYMSPEMIANQLLDDNERNIIDQSHDMWSCGVIMYLLLVGFLPFLDRREVKVKKMIASGEYNFNRFEWQNISMDAIDLVRKLINVNRKDRWTADECLLNHSFLK